MLKQPTTLILGAGASCPYGFPSGAELREQICSGLSKENSELFKFLAANYTNPHNIRAFRDAFSRSQMYSIDAFLARRPEFTDVGKASIAAILIGRERLDSVLNAQEDHWYRYLWNQIAGSWESLEKTNLSIVTFNYDRSLEYFLLEAMKAAYGKKEDECAAQLANIPILHVYGKLGAPTFASADGRPYQPTLDQLNLTRSMESIRVIPEQREDDEVFATAFTHLNMAAVICFLGFGYDRLNLRRLGMERIASKDAGGHTTHGKEIYGTTFKLRPAEVQSVTRSCGTDAAHLSSMRCEEMLRTHGILIDT